MRWVPVQACRSGMRLAKKIFNEEGFVLLEEHVELNASYIQRLLAMGVSHVYIEDELTEGIDAPNLLSEDTRRMANKTIRQQFKLLMNDKTSRKRPVSSTMNRAFIQVLDAIIDDLSNHDEAMVMLNDIQTTDHYLFRHSLNVCVYTTLLGMHYGYEREALKTLSMGALLHDIGKTQIDLQILTKPGKLTDSEFDHIKQHAELGYRILKNEPNIPILAAHCAYQHHERLNGCGYPRGITSPDIHEYARWIGITDSYDAMTTHRVYRQAMLPHEALEILYTGSGTLYEQSMLALFRDRIAVYPIGMSIVLSNGETGVVASINAHCPQRPVVRILYDSEGNRLSAPRELNLSECLHMMIVGADTEKIDPGRNEAYNET
ncbi:HD-GYP domain-containing protein [Paenibacillus sp. OSY-SE]|uniref:HD-GYP domain-containing protein n=2 Tax=unclassified Paenibacillus TaxID=185978 RepID=UPI000367628A|nr:HD-GYP domain-containing protein [Paenibacillus sp. OSY-SE]MCM3337945.1 HD-GYP domain-containing protein [Paenibacillus sp. MER TA 81-3]